MTSIVYNLKAVHERIERACAACGRENDPPELVAVSKKKDVPVLREALEAGIDLFGENRIQEVMVKQPELPGHVRWHLVGHLQSNKVKHAIHCGFELIHSVDSEKLLRALDRTAAEQGVNQAVLLQVNVSGEGSKYGISPGDLIPLLESAADCVRLDVQGLMTIPPASKDPADAAPFFAVLRELRNQAAEATGFDLPHLSMGMSHDLEVAIRVGATLVRVGTDIFGKRS